MPEKRGTISAGNTIETAAAGFQCRVLACVSQILVH